MNHVCFSVSVCENCPRMLRRDFESAVCAEYEVAGIVRGLLSLRCSADVIPGRFEVRRLIMENSVDHVPRLQLFSETRFRSLLAEKFPDTAYGEAAIIVVWRSLFPPWWILLLIKCVSPLSQDVVTE